MIDVEIEEPAWTVAEPRAGELARAAAGAVFQRLGRAGAVTVLLAADPAVAELNARFRRKTGATNVLSFPAAPTAQGQLGDLALAYGVCAREAASQGKTLGAHLQHLVAHGVLHLLGYDHVSDAQADEMEGLERVVLAGLGISDPYAAGEGDHD